MSTGSDPPPVQRATQSEPPSGRFSAIAAGGTGCGIRENGSIECWGTGAGGLAEGAPETGSHVALDVGLDHACALATDGSVVYWGSNDRGHPYAPTYGAFVAIAVGYRFTCAQEKGVEALQCWGRELSESTPLRFG